MKLLLTLAGFTNKTIINGLKSLVDKPFEKLNLAFIPTAANVEEGDKGWLINDLYRTKSLGFAGVDMVVNGDKIEVVTEGKYLVFNTL